MVSHHRHSDQALLTLASPFAQVAQSRSCSPFSPYFNNLALLLPSKKIQLCLYHPSHLCIHPAALFRVRFPIKPTLLRFYVSVPLARSFQHGQSFWEYPLLTANDHLNGHDEIQSPHLEALPEKSQFNLAITSLKVLVAFFSLSIFGILLATYVFLIPNLLTRYRALRKW